LSEGPGSAPKKHAKRFFVLVINHLAKAIRFRTRTRENDAKLNEPRL
jgi:hypothetical protein